jgi:oxygen-independent coproporphyrinogen-3 oxidase
MAAISPPETAFAVYLHWPFCKAKCPYCDFNSFVAETPPDPAAWLTAYQSELAHFAAFSPNRRVTSVFFGGGTPSLMPEGLVAGLLETIDRLWGFADAAEITLEANPTSAEAARFAGYKAAGVNRVSVGLQALDDTDLRFLGRQHSAAEGLAAWELARSLFDRASLDLIYARPQQSLPAWLTELERALALAPDHISLYQLTIEPNTVFASDVRRGLWQPLDEELAADLFLATRQRLAAAGLPAYEVSNHAKPGQESRHNLCYWRYQDYVGVGPGAHGRLTLNGQRWASRQHKAPPAWLSLCQQQGHATRHWQSLEPEDAWQEALIMGLRLREGLPLARLEALAGRPVEALLDLAMVQRLCQSGDLALQGTDQTRTLVASDPGIERLDAILGALVRV